jgi:phenylalanyl-tRNA synthetase alpha chain
LDKSIEQIHQEALQALEEATDHQAIQDVKVRYLGRKGIITQFLRNVSTLPADQRPAAGKKANQVKNQLDEACKEAILKLETAVKAAKRGVDVSLPGRPAPSGSLHPITQINKRICDIFGNMGFEIAEGPEVELDDIVLRTHTSPLQIRTMEKQPPPVRIIMPGKVYRCDSDLTHTPMFHQVEGLLVDENISFGDLKGTLTAFVHQMFDEQTSLRFRPGFFPFTEPSAEVDILCVMCRGKGCRVCSHTGWLEILGSGMVHPALYENVGYEADRYTGFAFGMGVDRIAMLKYGIDDIRKFFENDIRFLSQF